MNNNLINIIEIIEKNVKNDDFLEIADDYLEEALLEENAFDIVEKLLLLIESNPEVDFGNPGPIVHFVEKFYNKGYEEKLLESIKRVPTLHTLWMLNRIINGATGETQVNYIQLMQNIANNEELDEDIRAEALDFLS